MSCFTPEISRLPRSRALALVREVEYAEVEKKCRGVSNLEIPAWSQVEYVLTRGHELTGSRRRTP